jgi:hypothetical protein
VPEKTHLGKIAAQRHPGDKALNSLGISLPGDNERVRRIESNAEGSAIQSHAERDFL